LPIYEYECTKCKNRVEIIQKVSDPPLKRCRECKGSLQKIVSAAGLQFKGSGWYITDYAKKNGQPTTPQKEEKKAESGSASESASPSESSAKKDSTVEKKPSKKQKD